MPQPKRNSDTVRARFLTVGQTARIVGVSPSTLRLWESVGLISPARSTGKYRLFNPEMLELLKRIKYLRDVQKLNVPGIKQVLDSKQVKAPGQVNNQSDIGAKFAKVAQEPGAWSGGSSGTGEDFTRLFECYRTIAGECLRGDTPAPGGYLQHHRSRVLRYSAPQAAFDPAPATPLTSDRVRRCDGAFVDRHENAGVHVVPRPA